MNFNFDFERLNWESLVKFIRIMDSGLGELEDDENIVIEKFILDK